MTTMSSYDTYPNRDSWLNDPLDIMLILDAIENDEEIVALGMTNREFRISTAGYGSFDKTLPLYRVEPARYGEFVPMGFYSVPELHRRLEQM